MKLYPGSPTLGRWVLFNTLGWLLGILVIVGLALLFEAVLQVEDGAGGQAAVGIGMGAGVGFMQWMALSRHLEGASKLFTFTWIGLSVAFILRDVWEKTNFLGVQNSQVTVEATLPFAGMAGGILAGWLQYQFLFKKRMKGASAWIAVSALGWVVATLATLGIAMPNFLQGIHLPGPVIAILALLFLTIGGPILGLITGIFLLPKLKSPSIPG